MSKQKKRKFCNCYFQIFWLGYFYLFLWNELENSKWLSKRKFCSFSDFFRGKKQQNYKRRSIWYNEFILPYYKYCFHDLEEEKKSCSNKTSKTSVTWVLSLNGIKHNFCCRAAVYMLLPEMAVTFLNKMWIYGFI